MSVLYKVEIIDESHDLTQKTTHVFYSLDSMKYWVERLPSKRNNAEEKKKFGEILREMREQNKNSMQDLADFLGIEVVELSDIERGRKHVYDLEILYRIALWFKIDLNEVMKWIDYVVNDNEDKFTFKQFEQVLVRDCDSDVWQLSLYAYKEVKENSVKHVCINGCMYNQAIPYKYNEHLLGTNVTC